MRCKYFNDLSDDWIQEKMKCTNLYERKRVRKIRELIDDKRKGANRCFSAQEFTDFLRFKGLGRSVDAFLERYEHTNKVEKVTGKIFESELQSLSFNSTNDQLSRKKIIDAIRELLNDLQTLDFVGVPVASACLALCFPELCGTVDYIVPAMLHNEYDDLGKSNPLFMNAAISKKIRESLLLPVYKSLTPKEARDLGTSDYTLYLQELWNIKGNFGSNHQIREIEVAFWSFGICYLKKQKRDEKLPLEFSDKPNPPKGGSFSKYCPNDLLGSGV